MPFFVFEISYVIFFLHISKQLKNSSILKYSKMCPPRRNKLWYLVLQNAIYKPEDHYNVFSDKNKTYLLKNLVNMLTVLMLNIGRFIYGIDKTHVFVWQEVFKLCNTLFYSENSLISSEPSPVVQTDNSDIVKKKTWLEDPFIGVHKPYII